MGKLSTYSPVSKLFMFLWLSAHSPVGKLTVHSPVDKLRPHSSVGKLIVDK